MKSILPLIFLVFIFCSEKKENASIDFYLEINENRIHCKINGEGEELVLVHGGYLDLYMWQLQVNKFKDERRIIRFSDLGHGNTIGKNPLMGYEIIDKLTNATEQNPTTIVGLSWGAMICVDYALNYPHKVKKMILVSPGLNGWEYFQDTLAAKNNHLRKIATQNDRIRRSAELFHQNWVIGPKRGKNDLDKDFYNWSFEMIYENMENHWKEDWSTLDSIPARERLDQITVPTYIIIGSEDAEDIKCIADEYDQRVPNSKKIVINDAAHLLNVEHPEKFNKIFENILNE